MGALKLSYYEGQGALEKNIFFQGRVLGKSGHEEKKRFKSSTYGFIGQENDNEVKNNTGTFQYHGFRAYDSRLGKYMSLDPLASNFVWNSPYSYAENDVIRSIDLEGGEKRIVIHYNQNGKEKYKTVNKWYDITNRKRKTEIGVMHMNYDIDKSKITSVSYDASETYGFEDFSDGVSNFINSGPFPNYTPSKSDKPESAGFYAKASVDVTNFGSVQTEFQASSQTENNVIFRNKTSLNVELNNSNIILEDQSFKPSAEAGFFVDFKSLNNNKGFKGDVRFTSSLTIGNLKISHTSSSNTDKYTIGATSKKGFGLKAGFQLQGSYSTEFGKISNFEGKGPTN